MDTLLLATAAALLSLVNGACHTYEKDYYEELGCVPTAKDSACPDSYDCNGLSKRSGDKCHYKGKAYDQGQKLEANPATVCLAECRCQAGYPDPGNSRAAFSCVSIECPELFNGPPPPGCYRTHEHGKCCYTEEICGSEAEQKTPKETCKHKDETLQIGQKFYPEEEPCMQCICQSGFNGSLVEPYCHKVMCNLELHDGHHIADGCIPVYYGEKGCCPIDWRCPAQTDSVVPVSGDSAAKTVAGSSEKTCKFGNLTMRIGDQLSTDTERGEGMTCSCRVPPHPVCIQRESQQ